MQLEILYQNWNTDNMGDMSAFLICVSKAHFETEGASNTFCGSKTVIISCLQHLGKKFSRDIRPIMLPSTLEFWLFFKIVFENFVQGRVTPEGHKTMSSFFKKKKKSMQKPPPP